MLGDKIRKKRKEKGLTLVKLAKLTDLTSSYISQIERNSVDPSISSLRKIAIALEAPIYTFLDSEKKPPSVVRANNRKKLKLPDSKVTYEFITPLNKLGTEDSQLEIVYFELAPKSWSREDYSQHNAEECIFVLSNTLIVEINDEQHTLYKGDSIYISVGLPHRAYNPSNTPTTAMMCITPPVY